MHRLMLALVPIGLFGAVAFAQPAGEAEVVADLAALRQAGVGTGGEALLDFFRSRTATAAARERARALVRQLGDDDFAVRERASAALVALGPAAAGVLREAVHDPDAEVARRAARCLAAVEKANVPEVIAAAARVLAARAPPPAAAVLLAYLPDAPDDHAASEVTGALAALARRDERTSRALVAALTDTAPARRCGAAVALCRSGAAAQRGAVRKLLADPDRSVRLRVAAALVAAGDREAVGTLIALLGELPAEQGVAAEDLLFRLAGDTAPRVTLQFSTDNRRACRDAWDAWWRRHGADADLTRLGAADALLGYTVLVLLDDNAVVEWGRDGKERWRVGGLASPLDAQVLPGGRLLIAECGSNRVTERSLKGEVLRAWPLRESPIHAHRLANGNTLIVTHRAILEASPDGKRQAQRYAPGGTGIVTARLFPDGRIGCILGSGDYVLLDAAGKELRRFAVGSVGTTNALTPLPAGHILVVNYGAGLVREHDAGGKVVWEVRVGRPLCTARKANGNTLISTQDMVLIEYDRAGKEVGRRPAPGHPCQVRLR
jgi:hypothetical protein